MGFVDGYVERRIRKNTFFKQINTLIDWTEIEKEITKVYKRGHSVDGRPAYRGLLLFKMLLIGIWYDLSDEKVEESVNDSLSMMRFCDLEIEDSVPDHSVLSRFRTELTEKKAFGRLLKKINRQLVAHKVIIRNGVGIVDATLTDTPRCPDGKPMYEIAEDRKEDEREDDDIEKEEDRMKVVKKKQPGVDDEARYLKKGKELHFGYKKHILTDENGIQLSVHTTPANEHDSKGLKPCLENQDEALAVTSCYTDKGYQVPANVTLLQLPVKNHKVKNRIQHKAYRNRPLTEWQKEYNRLISKKRWVVERTFGGMRRWFRCGTAR
ncbi:MAG: IS5 family transposase, partial [Prevotellaceae bacterium]|nr:IS5 family transposase [Prevotellaceae bacterium]